jgi:hypothetical protein
MLPNKRLQESPELLIARFARLAAAELKALGGQHSLLARMANAIAGLLRAHSATRLYWPPALRAQSSPVSTNHIELATRPRANRGGRVRPTLLAAVLIWCTACRRDTSPPPGDYLFVWAGDSANKASDFLAVIDAAPSSPQYGSVVASLPTGVPATHPHHTEAELPPNAHLLANGFHAGTSITGSMVDSRHVRQAPAPLP